MDLGSKWLNRNATSFRQYAIDVTGHFCDTNTYLLISTILCLPASFTIFAIFAIFTMSVILAISIISAISALYTYWPSNQVNNIYIPFLYVLRPQYKWTSNHINRRNRGLAGAVIWIYLKKLLLLFFLIHNLSLYLNPLQTCLIKGPILYINLFSIYPFKSCSSSYIILPIL